MQPLFAALAMYAAMGFAASQLIPPEQEAQLEFEANPTPPDESASLACTPTYVGTITCGPNGYTGISLAAGWYLIDPYLSDTWSYSPGRWHNAYGDRLKSNRSGLIQPRGYFSQLLTRARTSVDGLYDHIPYNGDHWVYHNGGALYFLLNDRPGEYGDNRGAIRVKLWK